MNYLFFDIECATCRGGKGKICEFGYLLTDDNFNEIKREEILINPNSPFDWYTLKNLLHFTKNEYKSAPTYDSVYEKISKVLLEKDQFVFGHATKNDMKFLKDESDRYNLPYVDFWYSDIGIIFKNIFNLDEVRSLDKMCDDLEISQPEILHTAEADAYTTMRILKEMCKREKVNPDEFLKKYPSCFEKYDFTKKTKKELKKLKKTAE